MDESQPKKEPQFPRTRAAFEPPAMPAKTAVSGNKFSDTGYSIPEACVRAAKWWSQWRGAISKEFNRERLAGRSRGPSAGGAPSIHIQGDLVEVLPDGIASAKPWDALTRQEQLTIVKTWHHYHVRVPSLGLDKAFIEAVEKERAAAHFRTMLLEDHKIEMARIRANGKPN